MKKAITAEQFVALTTNVNYGTVELTGGFMKKVSKKLKEMGINSNLTLDDFDELHRKYPMNIYSGSHIEINADKIFIKTLQESTKELTNEEKNCVRSAYMKCV